MSETWVAGLILISVVLVIVAIPCFFVSFLGYQMLHRLAYFPSKNPAIQMSIFLWLIVVEIASIVMLITFYHIFADYTQEPGIQGARNYERLDDAAAVCYLDDGDYRRHDFLFT